MWEMLRPLGMARLRSLIFHQLKNQSLFFDVQLHNPSEDKSVKRFETDHREVMGIHDDLRRVVLDKK